MTGSVYHLSRLVFYKIKHIYLPHVGCTSCDVNIPEMKENVEIMKLILKDAVTISKQDLCFHSGLFVSCVINKI